MLFDLLIFKIEYFIQFTTTDTTIQQLIIRIELSLLGTLHHPSNHRHKDILILDLPSQVVTT